MQTFFITASGISSERWLRAFPDATTFTDEEFLKYQSSSDCQLNSESMVWVLLEGKWQECIKSSLAAEAMVVGMTLTEDVRQARNLLSMGVKGYVHAFATTELFVRIQDVIISGGAWLGASLLQQLLVNINKTVEERPKAIEGLTQRESAVAKSVAAGKSNKEVAMELGITERTVKAHLSSCFNKLNVRDRMQLSLAINK